jgi:undecaprenyl-diphosphatase
MTNLYNYLINLINNYSLLGYFLISILAFFESFAFIGLIVPGSIAVIVGGFLAAHGSMNIRILYISVFLAAVLGDSFSFHLGKTNIISFKKDNKFFKPELLTKGKVFFEKYGAKSVFLARFIGWVRPIVPFIAGLFELDIKVFLFWNILSGLLWAVAHIALGHFFGRSWQLVTLWSTRVSLFFSIFIVFLIIIYLLKWFALRKGKVVYQIFLSIWESIKNSILENDELKKFAEKHSSIFSFFKSRFDKNKFSGLPLTLFSISLLYVLALFAGVVEDLINSELITQIDLKIENSLVLFRNTDLTSIFRWLTLLGKWQVITIFLAAASLLFWLWNKKNYIFALIISVFGSTAFTAAGKIIFQRPRPAAALYEEYSYSFPSGHATIAVAFYGFLAYFLIKNIKNLKNKINIFFITLLIIVLIGFSRLYLGVHYFSDVWAGYLVGTIWLIISIGFAEYLFNIKKSAANKISIKYKKIISTVIILIVVASYSFFAYNYQFPNSTEEQLKAEVNIESAVSIFDDQGLKYTESLLGKKQEPISFIILAKNEKKLTELFHSGGWETADEVNFYNLYRLAKAEFFQEDYSNSPIAPVFWNYRVPGFNFVKAAETSNSKARHQIRIWKSNFVLEDEGRIYTGIISFTNKTKWGFIHQISPDLNAEREFLANNLNLTGMIKKTEEEKLVEAQIGENFSGDPFFTDGKIYIFFSK